MHGAWVGGYEALERAREVNRPSVDVDAGSRWMDALECRLVTGGTRVVKRRSDQDAGNWPDSRAMGRADTGWISGRSVAAQYDPTLRLPHPAYVPYLLLFLPIYIQLSLFAIGRSNFESLRPAQILIRF